MADVDQRVFRVDGARVAQSSTSVLGRAVAGASVVASMNPKLISLKEFAAHIGVSYSTVRRMVADKSIRVVRPHRRAMIPLSEVARYSSSAQKGSSPRAGDGTGESGVAYGFPAGLNS